MPIYASQSAIKDAMADMWEGTEPRFPLHKFPGLGHGAYRKVQK